MESELRQRIVTAIIGAVIFLVLVLPGGVFGSFLAFTVISVVAANEYAQMIFKGERAEIYRTMLMLFCASFPFWVFVSPGSQLGLTLLGFLTVFTYSLIQIRGRVEVRREELELIFRDAALWFFGFVYVGLLPSFFILIRGGANGLHWVMVFLLIHWLTDIGAYFGGKKWGRTKLFPEVSPKKSVEGLTVGVVTALFGILIYRVVFFQAMSLFAVVFLSVCIGVLAQVGDLAESLLKRACGVKDSGNSLPGHGGILDRFDGVVFTLPIMYTGLRLFS